jgi:hypothetical protein
VKFPPHSKVEDIKNLPSFNLSKEGVQVEVVEWIGDLEHFGELMKLGSSLKEFSQNGVIGQSLLR